MYKAKTAVATSVGVLSLILIASLVGLLAKTNLNATRRTIWSSYRDLKYGVDQNQSLDLFLPSDAHKPMPLIVFIHGGGWIAGDKRFATFFELSKHGCALASINYRLIWQAPFPAQIQDCKAAIAYLRSNAAKYKLDPDRIGVWGCSSGGQLAMLIAATGNDEVPAWENECKGISSRVAAVCDWAGPSDLVALIQTKSLDKSIRTYTKNLVGPLDSPQRELKLALASPVRYIKKGLPPVLIMHAKGDKLIPISQSEELIDCLKIKGVDYRFIAIDAPQHSFYTIDNEAIVGKFFDRTLERQ